MKNSAFSNYKVFAGNSHLELAEEITSIMGKPLGRATVNKFSDGEISVNLWESVRGVDCYIVQSTCDPVNDNLMELLIMIDAMKRASAGRINAVIPYYGYARQDRKAKARDPITAKLVANLLMAAGADRVLTMDLHAAQIQGYFDIPVDHLVGMPILTKHFMEENMDNVVVVSPDHGSVTRARNMAQPLNAPIAIVDKRDHEHHRRYRRQELHTSRRHDRYSRNYNECGKCAQGNGSCKRKSMCYTCSAFRPGNREDRKLGYRRADPPQHKSIYKRFDKQTLRLVLCRKMRRTDERNGR